MLHRVIRFFIENRLVAGLIVLLIVVFGLVSSPFNLGLSGLPRNAVSVDAIPDIGENQQIVFTDWPGQSPHDIEDQVTYPLTSYLLGMPGVKSVRGNSMFGFSSIYVIFDDDVDFYWSRSRILEKLNALPQNLLPESVQPRLGPDATALDQIYWYTIEGRDKDGNITGGWDLQELRSIQDFYIKNALLSAPGVTEVASIGGFVKEYQIDIDPELMKRHGISLKQLITAVKNSNRDVGAKTLEVNKVEYFVRGLGFVKSISDIEETTVVSNGFTPIRIKDVAKVSIGPEERRGILDKGGAEVVGGVITSRFGTNPVDVLNGIKSKIKEVQLGLPEKELSDGRTSKLTIVPFYDRSGLIENTINTLGNALTLEILIAILVVVLMLTNIRASLMISGLLPVSVLFIFIGMKVFKVEANVVALSGIAIAIGTIVDMGIILVENIVRKLREVPKRSIRDSVLSGSKEVSGAILTAGLTTIISFIPVFTLSGAEGKLFVPLAFTKTAALVASLALTLFVIPAIASFLFGLQYKFERKFVAPILFTGMGVLFFLLGTNLALILLIYGILNIILVSTGWKEVDLRKINLVYTVSAIIFLLGWIWRPLGFSYSVVPNLVFTIFVVAVVLTPIYFFIAKYEFVLKWVLNNKRISVLIPSLIVLLGILVMANTEKEFMPSLDEGTFLLMPTSMPHSGTEENKATLKKLDMAVASIPEIDIVVGKAGRVNSALDPAPLSMYENMISYKPEFVLDQNQRPLLFKTNEEGLFYTQSGSLVPSGSGVSSNLLIEDTNGSVYRNWRPEIRTVNDIWSEIVSKTQMPGITSSPKLHPIETRLVMLQTGMRSPLGIKVKGQDLESIEKFGLILEEELRGLDGIRHNSVFADRITGKPYVMIEIDRVKISKYGLSVQEVQQTLEVAVGGKPLSYTIEGRERYAIRARYPRELRSSPENLGDIYINTPDGISIPVKELVSIGYERGPQMIKSEDGFLVGYVTFDKEPNESEVGIVDKAKDVISKKIELGEIKVPQGITYSFSGTYENHLHAQKTLIVIVPMVLLVIFLILFYQFREIKVALMIFSSIAVAFAGGFILIWLYGQSWFLDFSIAGINVRDLFNIKTINLSVAVWIGFIALFGIATDDGVVMATYLRQSFKKQNPTTIEAIRESVVIAGKRRLIPCLMTTATTILALLPVLTSKGSGSDVMIPIAIPCFGGMLLALITLFVVPLLYCWQKEITLNSKRAMT